MSIFSNITLSNLKLEDETMLADAVQIPSDEGTTVTPEESAEQLIEIQQDQIALESDLESISEAEEAVAEVEEVVEQSEEVVEDTSATDEQIEQQIVVQQEAFAFALGKLGYSKKHLQQLKVNTESVSSAREKLKLHIEEDKGFIKKTWENIKKLLKKVWEFAANMVKKVLSWVKGLFIKKPPTTITEEAKENFEQIHNQAKEDIETLTKVIEDNLKSGSSAGSNIEEAFANLSNSIKGRKELYSTLYNLGYDLYDPLMDMKSITGNKAEICIGNMFYFINNMFDTSFHNIATLTSGIDFNKTFSDIFTGTKYKDKLKKILGPQIEKLELEPEENVIDIVCIGLYNNYNAYTPSLFVMSDDQQNIYVKNGKIEHKAYNVAEYAMGYNVFAKNLSDSLKNMNVGFLNSLYKTLIHEQKTTSKNQDTILKALKSFENVLNTVEKGLSSKDSLTSEDKSLQQSITEIIKAMNIIFVSNFNSKSFKILRHIYKLYNVLIKLAEGGNIEVQTPRELYK